MINFLYNFDNDEINYFIELLDNEMKNLDEKYHSLKDLKDEFVSYLSNNKEE